MLLFLLALWSLRPLESKLFQLLLDLDLFQMLHAALHHSIVALSVARVGSTANTVAAARTIVAVSFEQFHRCSPCVLTL